MLGQIIFFDTNLVVSEVWKVGLMMGYVVKVWVKGGLRWVNETQNVGTLSTLKF